ncbi:MAG: protease modulator HflC [Gammaproteobacteria bacterium]|uniref:Protein HflC n=1 Tax=Candidatus Thiopontia autotrophica TaxID=2841688 RepID=A0A8J6TSP6_9GAMM|nr:protease modulator HflC [Candidatus Thiopontia autotrophica]MBL6968748.1 protease modulator HflC [Gammaproteobacteria bacterium]
MNGIKIVLGVVVVALITFSMSAFIVDERELVIKFRLGEIAETDYKPGIHFQIPIVNNIRKFDKRIQTLDADPERYLTAEKKNVQVDSFVKWRIVDVETFFKSVGGDFWVANQRLSQVVKDGLRGEFGKRSVQEVISGERDEIMAAITASAGIQAKAFGIEVVDVRIKRVDLPQEVSNSVFRRMEAERDRIAKEFRSEGSEAAERIRAEADRQRTVIIAEANQKAEKMRGEGDAKATEIYATAYNKDPEFYAFYRSLGAYEKTFSSQGDLLVLEPDSEFFQYFNGKVTK